MQVGKIYYSAELQRRQFGWRNSTYNGDAHPDSHGLSKDETEDAKNCRTLLRLKTLPRMICDPKILAYNYSLLVWN